jgi:hypothetical protein
MALFKWLGKKLQSEVSIVKRNDEIRVAGEAFEEV